MGPRRRKQSSDDTSSRRLPEADVTSLAPDDVIVKRQRVWAQVWHNSGQLRWLILLSLVVFLSLFGFAWTQSPIVATEWFSSLIAALAFLAFGAGVVTLALTLPSFRAWLARPELEFSVWIKDPQGERHELANGGTVTIIGREFELGMKVTNTGNAPCVGGVNVFLRSRCSMTTADKLEVRPKSEDKILKDGEVPESCTVAVARTDFVCAIPVFYHAIIQIPEAGVWPIVVGVFTSIQNPHTGGFEFITQDLEADVATAAS
jgi:hypothetical protein